MVEEVMNGIKTSNNSESQGKKAKNKVRLNVSIYGRESALYIGKDVMRVLGAPKDVCLKVSPRMDSFVIMPCDEYNVLSFHVPDDFMLNSHRMMRVISKSFVTGLLAMNDLETGHTYKISGTYSEKNNAVIFNMSDIRRYR
jgi:hypothetical protein